MTIIELREKPMLLSRRSEPIGRGDMAARNGQTEPPFPKLPTCSVFAPFRE